MTKIKLKGFPKSESEPDYRNVFVGRDGNIKQVRVSLMKELTQYVSEEDARLMSTWLLENFKLKEGKVI